MAIFRLSATVISRSKGQSSVACAAYRAGEVLQDERCDQIHDYSKKSDVIYTEILLPENAPAWMKNREKLWNAVEFSEKRKDSQLAREVQLALPRELSTYQNIELTKDFIQRNFVAQGMVADIAIHEPQAADGENQPHAHVMLTMREVNSTGFGLKQRTWNQKCELENWRSEWCDLVNQQLAKNGFDLRVDHRSLADQGIDLIPQKKVGSEERATRMAAYREHVENSRINGERLLKTPEIVFDVLTNQQSTFTHQDIAKVINRYTANEEQFTAVYEKVKASDNLIYLGQDDRGRERFTTAQMYYLESEMVRKAAEMSARPEHGVNAFAKEFGLSSKQNAVLDYITESGNLKAVVGYAGSGKSKLLGAAKEIWEKNGYEVLGAALSGIAAENLQNSSNIPSRTIASILKSRELGKSELSNKHVLVIDEAGMIGSKQMSQLLDAAVVAQAKVVLVGDVEQLQAISAGAAFRAILEKTSYIELDEIWRQRADWQKEATVQFATEDTKLALQSYANHGHLHSFDTNFEAKQRLIDVWNKMRQQNPEKSQLIMAYTRQDVFDLNQMARDLRKEANELGPDYKVQTDKGERTFSEGDRIYFLQNDRQLDVKNGSLGTITKLDEHSAIVIFDSQQEGTNGRAVNINFAHYNAIDHGYAATVHKAQGTTVDTAFILASTYFDRNVTYVAMTRHRDNAEMFWSKEEFSNQYKLESSLSKERPKDVSLDYEGFANNRSIKLEDEKVAKGYQAPQGYEDLFTPKMIETINKDKDDGFADLFPNGKQNDSEQVKSAIREKEGDIEK